MKEEVGKEIPDLWSVSENWPCFMEVPSFGKGFISNQSIVYTECFSFVKSSTQVVRCLSLENSTFGNELFKIDTVYMQPNMQSGNLNSDHVDDIVVFNAIEVATNNAQSKTIFLITGHSSSLVRIYKIIFCLTDSVASGFNYELIKTFKSGHTGLIFMLDLLATHDHEAFYLSTVGVVNQREIGLRIFKITTTTSNQVKHTFVTSIMPLNSRPTCIHMEYLDEKSKVRMLLGDVQGEITLVDLTIQNDQLVQKGVSKMCKHVSPITDLTYDSKYNNIFSVGRDSILVLWKQIAADSDGVTFFKPTRVVPTFEEIECIVFHQESDILIGGGQGGKIRCWKVENGSNIGGVEHSSDEVAPSLKISDMHIAFDSIIFLKLDVLCAQPLNCKTVSISNPSPSPVSKSIKVSLNSQTISCSSILTSSHHSDKRYLLTTVPHDTPILKVYHLPSEGRKRVQNLLEMFELSSHEMDIHCLGTSDVGDMFVTVGREGKISIHSISDGGCGKVSTLSSWTSGHGSGVQCCSLLVIDVNTHGLITCDTDGVIKLWVLSLTNDGQTVENVKSVQTVVAHHSFQINAVACKSNFISNKKQSNVCLVATASHDKTIKLYSVLQSSQNLPKDEAHTTYKMAELAVLTGHRRGVTCISISPFGRVLASGSSDKTVRVWELNTFTCVKTMSGHLATVNSLIFTQLNMVHSISSDGCLIVWDTRNATPKLGSFNTLSNSSPLLEISAHDTTSNFSSFSLLSINQYHTIESEIMVVSRFTSSTTFSFWVDNSKIIEHMKLELENEAIEHDQTLSNLIHENKLLEAALTCIKLDRPRQLYDILHQYVEGDETILIQFINECCDVHNTHSDDFTHRLFEYITKWNSNSRTFLLAQKLISQYLLVFSTSTKKFDMSQIMSFAAFSQKHLKRYNKLIGKLSILDTLLIE